MGGSGSKDEGEHDETGTEMTTKKTVCTTISGGRRRKRTHRTHRKRSHSKRHSRRR